MSKRWDRQRASVGAVSASISRLRASEARPLIHDMPLLAACSIDADVSDRADSGEMLRHATAHWFRATSRIADPALRLQAEVDIMADVSGVPRIRAVFASDLFMPDEPRPSFPALGRYFNPAMDVLPPAWRKPGRHDSACRDEMSPEIWLSSTLAAAPPHLARAVLAHEFGHHLTAADRARRLFRGRLRVLSLPFLFVLMGLVSFIFWQRSHMLYEELGLVFAIIGFLSMLAISMLMAGGSVQEALRFVERDVACWWERASDDMARLLYGAEFDSAVRQVAIETGIANIDAIDRYRREEMQAYLRQRSRHVLMRLWRRSRRLSHAFLRRLRAMRIGI